MKVRLSFSLIEFLIYSTAGYILVVIVLGQLWAFHAKRRERAHYHNHVMSAVAALDLMRREIAESPCLQSYWFAKDGTKILWQTSDGRTRGYLLDETKLVRVEGIYDHQRNAWRDKSSSLMLYDVSQVVFHSVKQHEFVKAVAIDIVATINGSSRQYHDWIVLRNQPLGEQ